MGRIKGTGALCATGPRHRSGGLVMVVLVVCLNFFLSSDLQAYNPNSPEVKAMLAQAMSYLESCPKSGESARLGGHCLIGLAAYKYNNLVGNPDELPALTQEGLSRALGSANSLDGTDNYSVGIALILLCEVHAADHVGPINLYVEEIKRRQKPHGGWGYQHSARAICLSFSTRCWDFGRPAIAALRFRLKLWPIA